MTYRASLQTIYSNLSGTYARRVLPDRIYGPPRPRTRRLHNPSNASTTSHQAKAFTATGQPCSCRALVASPVATKVISMPSVAERSQPTRCLAVEERPRGSQLPTKPTKS